MKAGRIPQGHGEESVVCVSGGALGTQKQSCAPCAGLCGAGALKAHRPQKRERRALALIPVTSPAS